MSSKSVSKMGLYKTHSLELQILKLGSQIGWKANIAGQQTNPVLLPQDQSFDAVHTVGQLFRSLSILTHRFFPMASIEFEISPEISQSFGSLDLFHFLKDSLINTNTKMLENTNKIDIASNFKNALFYPNAECSELVDIKKIYDLAEERTQEKVFYKEFFYKEALRKNWNLTPEEKQNLDYFNINHLIEFICENEIGIFFTDETHYHQTLLNLDRILLSPILQMLGVKPIFYYYASLDVSVAAKLSFSSDTAHEYFVGPIFYKDWQALYQSNNKRFHPGAFFRGRPSSPKLLPDDYSIGMAANPRLKSFYGQKKELLYVLDTSTSDENLFEDFQTWYVAIRWAVLTTPSFSLSQKEKAVLLLRNLMLSGMALFKCMMLEEASKFRRTKIFGSKHWKVLFPDLYQDRYLDDDGYKEVFGKGKALKLLGNQNWGYYSANMALFRAIDLETPYLALPPLSRKKELEGLRTLEIRSIAEMISKLDQINDLTQSSEYIKSREFLITEVQNMKALLAKDVTGNVTFEEYQQSEFQKGVKLAINDINAKIKTYCLKHQATLFEQAQRILANNQEFEFDVKSSRFMKYEFLQRLFALDLKSIDKLY